jgi:Na+-transporting methylmalonyl-CoA/oxaloacetate decarboxylase gamma subunit
MTDAVKELMNYGVLGIIVSVILILVVWFVRTVGKAIAEQYIPAASESFKNTAKLAETCTDEMPKISKAIENSTKAVESCSAAVKQCHSISVTMVREHREARDGAVLRDQEMLSEIKKIKEDLNKGDQ